MKSLMINHMVVEKLYHTCNRSVQRSTSFNLRSVQPSLSKCPIVNGKYDYAHHWLHALPLSAANFP